MSKLGTPTKATVIRTVLLLVALVNQVLVMTGHSVLPFENEQIEEVVGLVFTITTSIAAWWKNNSFTEAAIEADELLKK